MPIGLQLLCGFPRAGLSDKEVTLRGSFSQLGGIFFLCFGIVKYWYPIDFFTATLLSFILSLVATAILYRI